ncbi:MULTISPECIES: helix-turn-helix transcriptional regulator [unclassified Moraxella]|uniref:ArsR/SmtB family transcription factor n=1 Tax=unclassified Moraxella TaxID=2685852 RepID=UPI002B40E3D9|nr:MULTISPECIES: helix-turn-helix transcriptional regulator [unclassified Moraxella]
MNDTAQRAKQATEVFKALANDYRLDMLIWLKDPKMHFPNQTSYPDEFDGGVCVGQITQKTGLAQSVVSGYLNSLKKAGLVQSKRIGKWTYYRYNSQAVHDFLGQLTHLLS